VRKSRATNATATAIRVALVRKSCNQGALANHLALSRSAFHRRMAGQVDWRVAELEQVADYLGITVSELVSA
jgi:hypothetical protein